MTVEQAPQLTDGTGIGAAGYTSRQVFVVFCGLALGMLLAALDQAIVVTALPTIVGDVGGINHLSWVVTAYLLASTVSTPLYGRLGDLYGRKRLFQIAIVIFLCGSVLCGISRTMPELIGARAIQGAGGGGLIVLGMAMIADVVSPRERGRFQGYFGALFGLASVTGPLLGGLFTDHLTWRWVFYINLPLGVAALAISRRALPQTARRSQHQLDYVGASLLIGAITCFVLVTTWGGTQYPWTSPIVIGLIIGALVLGTAFVLVERVVPEPVMPLRLFSNPTMRISGTIALILGMAMFCALSFLPLLLQVADGATATNSAFVLMPLMVAVPIASVVSGQVVTRTGRYKFFPVLGMALVGLGYFLLSHITPDTPRTASGVFMAIVGLGIGLTMPVVVLAVQNTCDSRELGVATSTVTFFRSVGGSLGVAAFGAIFSARLVTESAKVLPAGIGSNLKAASVTPEAVHALPAALQGPYTEAFARALSGTYLFFVPLLAVGFVVTLFLKEVPLRTESHLVTRTLEEEVEVFAEVAPDDAAGSLPAPAIPVVRLADAD